MAALHPSFAGEVDLLAESQVETLLRLLKPPQGARMLDVGCGAGRHAILLQEQGYELTGVDLSPQILRQAQAAWSVRQGARPAPNFVPGDMRWLPVEGPFQSIYFMDMVLGVFPDDESHLQCLRSARSLAGPGARLLLEQFNPFYWAHNARTLHYGPGELLPDADVVRRYKYDPGRGRIDDEIVVMRAGGREALPTQTLRAWTPPELRRLLRMAGWKHVRFHGSRGWEPPEPGRPVDPKDSVFMWVTAEA